MVGMEVVDLAISIHALRVEGDPSLRLVTAAISLKISIHALRVEGDLWIYNNQYGIKVFLSTPSGWRATRGSCGWGA